MFTIPFPKKLFEVALPLDDWGCERGYYAGKTRAQADVERLRLFELMQELMYRDPALSHFDDFFGVHAF